MASDAQPVSERRENDQAVLIALHDRLLERFGLQGWWPGEGPWDVCAGAVLTQNTRWANAERALNNLADAGLRTPVQVLETPDAALQELIRSAGFFRSKGRALRGLAAWVVAGGGFGQLENVSSGLLREGLLAVPGVGPETADCILLYALNRPVFVADAYARRILVRTGIVREARQGQYAALKHWAEDRLPMDVGLMQEFHALIVALGKNYCQPRPRCAECPLRSACMHANGTY